MAEDRFETPGIYWQSRMGNNADGIGGNCHRYDIVTGGAKDEAPQRRALVVDYGVKFARGDEHDFISAAPDGLFEKASGSRLKMAAPVAEALIITHPHEDHLGAVPHLVKMGYKVPPVYATPFTAQVLAKKLASARIKTENWPEIKVVEPGATVEVAGARIEMVPVDHMPDAVGLRIATPEATVFHTGDFKFDDTLRLGTRADPARWSEIGKAGVDALISDSTSVGKGGERVPEEAIARNLGAIVAAQEGRKVVAGVLGSQMDRMLSLMRAARENGRVVVLAGYSVENNIASLKAAGHDLEKAAGGKLEILTRRQADARGIDPAKALVITTGAFAQRGAGLTRAADDGGQGWLAQGPDTTVLIPQSVIPPVKDEYAALVANLERHGSTVITPDRAVEQGFGPIHKSGHADRADTAQALALLKPKMLLPIHGDPGQIATHARTGEELGVPALALPTNGAVVRVNQQGAQVVERQELAQVGIKDVGTDWRAPFLRYDRLDHQGSVVKQAAYGLPASKFAAPSAEPRREAGGPAAARAKGGPRRASPARRSASR